MSCSLARSALNCASRDALEVVERVGPELTETRARLEAEARFARSLRRIVADVAIEVLIDELEDLPS
jgi:hypothetical protein